MIFPDDPDKVVKKYLLPKESKCNNDIVAQFGMWLRKKGVSVALWGTLSVLIACILVKLILTIQEIFQEGLFSGIFILIFSGPILLVIALCCFYLSVGISLVVAAIVWLISWVFYNKWTLIGSLFLISLGVFCLYHRSWIENILDLILGKSLEYWNTFVSH